MILGALVIVVLGFIVINYFRSGNSGQIQTGTSTEAQNPEQPIIERGEGPVKYTVTAGENLWSIAQKQYGSGYNWVDIQEANKITNPDAVNAGQQLTIPDVAPRVPEVLANENQDTAGSLSGTSYKVMKGDSLWNIALRAYGDGNQWVKISTSNKLANPNVIHSGNTLSLPR